VLSMTSTLQEDTTYRSLSRKKAKKETPPAHFHNTVAYCNACRKQPPACLLANYVGWLTGQENNGQKLHAEGARSCFRILVLVFVLPMPSTLQEDTTYRCLSLSSICHCLSNFVGQIYCTSYSLSGEKNEERNASSCAFPQNVVNLEDRN
jgi:hypothetical protein